MLSEEPYAYRGGEEGGVTVCVGGEGRESLNGDTRRAAAGRRWSWESRALCCGCGATAELLAANTLIMVDGERCDAMRCRAARCGKFNGYCWFIVGEDDLILSGARHAPLRISAWSTAAQTSGAESNKLR